MTNIHIDFQKQCGKIKVLNAVNGGPVKAGRSQKRSNFDDYKALKIAYSRNHDEALVSVYGGHHVVDVNNIFTNFDADVNDPNSYDFFLTDKHIKETFEAGTETYYRLGASIEHWDKKYNVIPPKDTKKWAQICEHIIAHYNEGWADGFAFNIKYWEIWNEPETDDNQPPETMNCWVGTKQQFFEFFAEAATYLKSKFPAYKIGGPALCWDHTWGRDFVKYMSERNVPLDFYSWHMYTARLGKLDRDARTVREYLDAAGYTATESHLNEWNYVEDWNDGFVDTLIDISRARGAAFFASASVRAQHLPIDMMMYYDCRARSPFNGLFDVRTYYRQPTYYAFKAISDLVQLGTEVEAVYEDEALECMAAVGKEGKAGIISCYHHDRSIKERAVSLDLGSCADHFVFYEISDEKTWERIDIALVNGKADFVIKADSVIYFTSNE